MAKASKYNAQKTLYNGVYYDSKKEAAFAAQLDFRIKAGLIESYKRQVKYSWVEVHIANEREINFKRSYIADFVTVDLDGVKEVIDVKGYRTSEYLKKKKIVEKLFNIKITER